MSKKIIYFIAGMLSGGFIVLAITWYRNSDSKQEKQPSSENLISHLEYPLHITMKRFELNDNNENKFNSWMRFYHDHDAENILTMEAEKMYFETMFRDTARQKETVYWLTICGEGGVNANNSPFEFDKRVNEYEKEIIGQSSGITMKTEFYLLPDFIKNPISQHQ